MGLQFEGFKSSETKRGKINSLKALNFMQILKFALGTHKKNNEKIKCISSMSGEVAQMFTNDIVIQDS